MIRAGRVSVDGRVVRELGLRVDPDKAAVFVDAERVKVEKPVYWLVHKPRGYLCTNHDPAGRPRAIDLVEHVEQRVYTVGRLDEASEGLLLLTNDGDLAFRLMHPRFGVEKTYLVQVAGSPSPTDLKRLTEGVWIAEGRVRARHVKRVKQQGESTWLRIILCEGKNREIRRMLAKLGHKVLRLRRIAIGPVQLDRLPAGKARRLKATELAALHEASKPRPRGDKARRSTPPASAAPRPAERRPRPAGTGRGPRPEAGERRSPRPEPGRPGRSAGPRPGERGETLSRPADGRPREGGPRPGGPRPSGPRSAGSRPANRGGRPGGRPKGRP
jgi:23S rRNA pseudouridine2605 synthase